MNDIREKRLKKAYNIVIKAEAINGDKNLLERVGGQWVGNVVQFHAKGVAYWLLRRGSRIFLNNLNTKQEELCKSPNVSSISNSGEIFRH